ncbi:MAG TPA: sulfate transporter family protein [Roseiarcus sp.]|nr:sulfate transporter family protein [Roseiarcus sp.]
MLADALDAFSQIFSPPFRRVMWKSLALTGAILAAAGFALDRLAVSYIHVGPAWLSFVLSTLVGLGLFVGAIVLAPPAVSLVASFHLDEIAGIVERSIDSCGAPGTPLPFGPALALGLRFAVLSIAVNLVVLVLTVFTGVGLAAFFVLNGYLIGREYFELAAMRRVSASEARDLFDRHWLEVFGAGVIVAALVAVPVLNLIAPLFATALMIRVVKRVS